MVKKKKTIETAAIENGWFHQINKQKCWTWQCACTYLVTQRMGQRQKNSPLWRQTSSKTSKSPRSQPNWKLHFLWIWTDVCNISNALMSISTYTHQWNRANGFWVCFFFSRSFLFFRMSPAPLPIKMHKMQLTLLFTYCALFWTHKKPNDPFFLFSCSHVNATN